MSARACGQEDHYFVYSATGGCVECRQDRPQRVDLAEIDVQRGKGWPDFHPEDYCHRCGGRNVYSWHAPNEVWNRLAETGLLPSSEIVCPQCFTDLARQIGVEPSVWHLVADGSAS